MKLLTLILISTACTNSPGYSGDVTIAFQGTTVDATDGVAFHATNALFIAFGTDAFPCGEDLASNLENLPPSGTYAELHLTATVPGLYPETGLVVMHLDRSNIDSIDTTGSLSIDAIDDDTVSGSIAKTEPNVGGGYAVNGTFTVPFCN